MIHKFFVLCVGLTLLAACSDNGNFDELDMHLTSKADENKIPGFVVMAADRKGIIFSGAYGKADISTDRNMTADTLIRIASMTKPITSVAAMQLVEKGLIELDTPVGNYLDSLSELQIVDRFDQRGNPVLRPFPDGVTLRQLLTHTSGFVYEFSNRKALQYSQLDGVGTVFEPGDGFLNVPLFNEPGSKWEYGIGVDWVGVLIEEISGQSLEAYFKEHIFDPLGMENTMFHLTEKQQMELAPLYVKSDDGELSRSGPWKNDSFFSGGSGLVSTSQEYLKFLQMIMNRGELDGRRILKPETVDIMIQNNIGNLDASSTLPSYFQNVSRDIRFFSGSKAKFGLGFLINSDPVPERRAEGSLTWGGLYNTYFWIDPKNGICGVFMAQMLPFFDEQMLDIFYSFEKGIYQHHKMRE